MPEGLVLPRFNNIGPLSRSTEEDIKETWDNCPKSGKPREICGEIKLQSLAILQGQGVFAQCDDIVDINGGFCKRVAVQVAKEVEDVRVIKIGDKDHVWIEYRGKHYDAEVPTGVDDPFDLPFFDRIYPEEMLKLSKMIAEEQGREPPETVEETIEDITDEVLDD